MFITHIQKMKKTLLLIAGLAVATCAMALTPKASMGNLGVYVKPVPAAKGEFTQPMMLEVTPSTPMKGPEKAASGTVLYNLAGAPYTALGLNNSKAGMQVAQAFEFSTEAANAFAGNYIKSINFYMGGAIVNNQLANSNISMYTVFVAEDFGAQLNILATKNTLCSSKVPGTPYSIDLDQPFAIEAGKSYVIGCYCTLKGTNDSPIIIDYEDYPAGYDAGGWIGIRSNTASDWSWQNITADFGFVCVSAYIQGDNLPENMASIEDTDIAPAVNANTPFEVDFQIKNQGCNNISSVEYTCQVGDEPAFSGTYTLLEPIGFNETAWVEILDATYATASKNDVPVKVTVTKVNGVDNGVSAEGYPSRTGEGSCVVVPKDKGYMRNLVIEEGTSIGCGWCPYGIIALDYLNKNYTDGTFATVAVHSDFQGTTDPMKSTTYAPFLNNMITAFPTAWVNRRYLVQLGGLSVMPYLDMVYDYVRTVPGLGEVTMDVTMTPDGKEMTFNTKSAFVFDYDGDAKYRLSFAITEDSVGPYSQNNYLNGQQEDDFGWESAGSSVSTIFDDVARKLDNWTGIIGSVPATIEAEKTYEFSHTTSLTDCKITNVNKITALCYLIDTATGKIENVCKVKNADIVRGESGITDITADNAAAPVEYYNLQGIRVANPQGGIFIRRQGNEVTKVVK